MAKFGNFLYIDVFCKDEPLQISNTQKEFLNQREYSI
jgi:hypothetical protein